MTLEPPVSEWLNGGCEGGGGRFHGFGLLLQDLR